MPILGVVASSISGNLATNSYYSIATTTVGAGGAASVTFTDGGAWTGYTHLHLRCFTKNSLATNDSGNIRVRFNSDSTSSYYLHRMSGNGATTAAYSYGLVTEAYLNPSNPYSGSSETNMFGVSIVDILDFANTNKYKVLRSFNGLDTAALGICAISLNSDLWINTSAITSILLLSDNNFAQYSQIALYGIK